ncbi:cupin domain-containing protein [Hydrogenophaga sp. BPS33]|uniref:cupin domain-containing protein n=1 Tax=Hydrogenophaga sp. BPS33 TaxID=2651974 RepID=UPI00131FAECA|nr:cupin domain-containing protein [Hydrogenophaga sp. BPS33]QHE85984.1 cupin domain-containing protein [Hydrogenophaga sp. BPS33]
MSTPNPTQADHGTTAPRAFIAPAQLMNWNDLPREKMRPGIERAGFGGDHVLCQFAWVQPGATLRPHSHDFDQLVVVVEGECIFHVGGVPHACRPGSLLRVPPHTEHYIEVVGDKPVFEIDLFAPVREDYAHLMDHQREPAA